MDTPAHDYRREPADLVDPAKVQIGRMEYAQLRRAAEILDRMEDGVYVSYNEGRCRYRWQVEAFGELTEYGHDLREGRGPTFREAAEIAFEMPSVESWHRPVPPRRPWKRFVLLGALLTLGLHWLLTTQVPV